MTRRDKLIVWVKEVRRRYIKISQLKDDYTRCWLAGQVNGIRLGGCGEVLSVRDDKKCWRMLQLTTKVQLLYAESLIVWLPPQSHWSHRAPSVVRKIRLCLIFWTLEAVILRISTGLFLAAVDGRKETGNRRGRRESRVKMEGRVKEETL